MSGRPSGLTWALGQRTPVPSSTTWQPVCLAPIRNGLQARWDRGGKEAAWKAPDTGR